MKLGEQIHNLRKQHNWSQEDLAEKLNVTRQTISNWELDSTSPNPEQLKSLSKIFQISIDELLDNWEFCQEKTRHCYGYEYVSKTKIKGIPLVHINLGLGRGIRKAKGIIAIGNVAKGVIALGGVALGIISLGGLSLGLLALGGAALGLLLSIGGFSLGSIALGGIALGIFSIGGIAIGFYSVGGIAVARYVAAGDYAYGYLAVGNHVKGTVELLHNEVSSSLIKETILKHFPHTWNFIVFVISNVTF